MKTYTMKKVLIALDYDPSAQKIAETGYSLAKAMEAEVILTHVVVDSVHYSSPDYSPIMGFSGYMDMGPIQIESIESLKKASQHFLEKSKHHLGDENIQIIVAEGDISKSIIKTAKEIHADVIVMGTHSRRWLDEILMGSVTEYVMHHSSIPLLIIPTKEGK
jgi:nucleotide-binding universal stress UspA family protein